MSDFESSEDDYFSDEESISIDSAVNNVSVKGKKAAEDASKRYVKKTPHEHVLTRPDSYIGSIEMTTADIWVYDDIKGMNQRKVSYVPGLYKIFDEILVNAADHKQRDSKMNTIKVELDAENNKISVYNNGEGIPIQMHSEEKIWIPEMIFGHLLTSSNYDDNEKKVTGGRNGYGAKLANIFSNEFTVETVDTNSKKKYTQTWNENMYKAGKAKITKSSLKNGYTQITFHPDLKKFGMDSLDKDIIALMTKRVYDVAGCNSSVKVYLNGQLLPIRNFTAYCKLYLDASQKCVFDKINDRWEVCVTHSDGQPEQVSFVNSINTIRGGTHVQVIQEKIAKYIIEQVKKKQKKGPTVKPHQVKQQTWIFVNCLIENPSFDSQTKETLTTKKANFGRSFSPSQDFFKKLNSTELLDRVLNFANFKERSQLKKTSGKKKERLTGIKKLCDANDAGNKKYAGDCTLILTEGDSAKTLAISGLSIVGRDRYGVFPLKGKLLNVRDASTKQIMDNEEISAITKILGLQHGKVYDRNSVKKELRYGKLMIMADQDHDGSHIKGLLINFIHHFWPSLIKCNDFLLEFITPIIKATKGKKTESFFTMPQYLNWKKELNGAPGWKIKYYKGLGTSTANEAKSYFKDLAQHRIKFKYTGSDNDTLIDMAFSKKKADDRKDWIRSINEAETFVDHTSGIVPYDDFINKELVLFSAADCERSIPSIVDGLKPGQRKILFCCFKRKLKDEIKVAQLAGYVSEQSAYHHGEASLMGTIIAMAQNFVGSNNINLLYPAGQFGTRLMGGKDSASPRYIFTRLSEITRTIFPESDDHLLEYLDDDGQSIEPKWYMPILPMVLVNGAEGIGTGWSTTIPNYNPIDIINNIRKLLKGEEPEEMHPWYNGFTGDIEVSGKSYSVSGVYEEVDEDTLRVTELPVKSWTQNYKEFLETILVDAKGKSPILSDFRDHSGDTTVDFTLKFEPGALDAIMKSNTLEKKLKLVGTKFSTTNMHLFSPDGEIKKYESVEDILKEFFELRLNYYHKRKEWLVKVKKEEVQRISNRVRFILMVINDELIVAKKKKDVLLKELEDLKFDKMPSASKKPRAKNAIVSEEDQEDSKASYNYLLSMPLWNLTMEKVESLKKEETERKQELNILLETTKEQMWSTDLDTFEEAFKNFQESIPNSKKGKKSRVIKTSTTKAKTTTTKSKAKTTNAKTANTKSSTPAKSKASTKKSKSDEIDDDEEMDDFIVSESEDVSMIEEIEDDDKEEEEVKPKKKTVSKTTTTKSSGGRKATTTKKSTVKETDTSADSDITSFFGAGKKRKPAKGKEPPAKVQKVKPTTSTSGGRRKLVLEVSDDSEDEDFLSLKKAVEESPKFKKTTKTATKAKTTTSKSTKDDKKSKPAPKLKSSKPAKKNIIESDSEEISLVDESEESEQIITTRGSRKGAPKKNIIIESDSEEASLVFDDGSEEVFSEEEDFSDFSE